MELKAKILNATYLLMDMLEECQDYEFAEDVVDAIKWNDKELLWDLEEQLASSTEEEEEY